MSIFVKTSTFYVSQLFGDDSFSGICVKADGKGNGPFQSIERALNVIEEYRKDGNEHPLTISFLDDYFLQSPIDISRVNNVTIESLGSRKRIIGGVRIEGWTRDRFNGVPCFSARLSPKKDGTPWNFTDLYVNGKRAIITRYPKNGTLSVLDSENQQKEGEQPLYGCSSKWLIVDPKDLSNVDRVADAMINYYHFWIDEHSPIESYDPNSGKLNMLYSSRFSVWSESARPLNGTTYYLTNVPNTFNSPCEWYLDKKQGIVYYIPENENVNPEDVEAIVPTIPYLIKIEGNDIRLRNLELTCTLGDYASMKTFDNEKNQYVDGDILYGSDIQSVCWAPGAVIFNKAIRCGMFSCYLHGVGIHGVDIREGCSHIRIENNRIEDICAGGVRIFGAEPHSDPSLAVSNCKIRSNHISHCGMRYAAGCGILLCHTSHNEILQNEIHDLEYSGISVGWVWGYSDSPTYGNLIQGNHIYNIGKGNLSDMGGIYILGKQNGTIISENRIHDISCYGYGAWGIYLDEGSSFVTVENNVVYRTSSDCFNLHYGSHNTIRNNIFFGENSSCIRTSKEEEHDEILLEQNIFITNGSPIYGFLMAPKQLLTRRNLLWDISKEEPTLWVKPDGKKYDMKLWQKEFGHDMESIISDPIINGLTEYDFRISDSSPAFCIGFEPITK